MITIEKIFDTYFKPPFKHDGVFIFDSNNQTVLSTCIKMEEYTLGKLVDIMNGNPNTLSNAIFTLHCDDYDCKICCKTPIADNDLFHVRAWGYLTSRCDLDNTLAAEIQNVFGQWCVDKFNNKTE